MAADALQGAIIAGFIIPVFQYAFLVMMDALPETPESTELSVTMIETVVGTLGLFPVISTVVAMFAAYMYGGWLALGAYIVMAIAASMLLGAPVLAVIVLLIAAAGMFILLAVNSGSRRRGPPIR